MSHTHAQPHRHHHHHRHRRRRIWPWVVGVLTVLVLALVACGVVGFQLFRQAKQVQAHESKAVSMLSQLASSDADKLADAGDVLPQIAQETKQASAIAHGGLWNFVAKMPFVGDDIATVQGMTTTIDGIVQESMPQFVDVMKTLSEAQIANGGDGINLQPIIAASEPLDKANASFQKQVRAYDDLKEPNIGMIRSAYDDGAAKLSVLADRIDALSNAFRVLPALLDDGQSRTYAVMAMTPSEMRSSGGLIGSVGELTTSDGTVHVGEFRSNGDYLSYGIGDHSQDMDRVFTQEGPLHMSFDIRDLAVFPNTADSAVAMRSIWDRTPWGKEQPLDGVIMVDPLFLQQLIAINGDVTLPDGTVLTGDDTAEFLMNTVYQKYPENETDALFGVVANQAMESMFSNMSIGKLYRTGEMMGTMAKGRHFTMYAFDEQVEQDIVAAGFTGQTPNSETDPSVGIYLTEQNPSKMGWYIKRSTKITQLDCGEEGAAKYHVEYTIQNTMTDEESKTLPEYITGIRSEYSDSHGTSFEKIVFMPPAGGTMSNFEVTGNGADPVADSLNFRLIYTTMTQVQPESTVTYSFDVTVSPDATQKLGVDETPTASAKPDVTYTKLCRVQ